jgi:hypothetical protein
MMPFIFGDPAEAVPYLFVLQVPILRCVNVEIVSILLDHLHHFELVNELLLVDVFHLSGPVYIAGF